MFPTPVGIPGSGHDAHLVENFPYICPDYVGCCGTPAVAGTICLGLGVLTVPGTFYRLLADHYLESNLARSPLSICHHTGNYVSVGSSRLFGTFPRLVVAHRRAQCVEPVQLADLKDCTHTGPWCVTGSYTTCIESASCILMWSDRG